MTSWMDGEQMSAAGRAVIDEIEAQLDAAGDDPARMNALPGTVKHYHLHVRVLGTVDAAAWLQGDGRAGAEAIWARVQAASVVDETDAALAALRDELARVTTRVRRLEKRVKG